MGAKSPRMASAYGMRPGEGKAFSWTGALAVLEKPAQFAGKVLGTLAGEFEVFLHEILPFWG